MIRRFVHLNIQTKGICITRSFNKIVQNILIHTCTAVLIGDIFRVTIVCSVYKSLLYKLMGTRLVLLSDYCCHVYT